MISDYSQLVHLYKELKQERDELAAQVEVMRDALRMQPTGIRTVRNSEGEVEDISTEAGLSRRKALSITGPDALREIQARTLESVRDYLNHEGHSEAALLVHEEAAAKRRGE